MQMKTFFTAVATPVVLLAGVPRVEAVQDFRVSRDLTPAAAVAAARAAGGGRVIVPAGEWQTAKLHLASDVELHLEEGATLVFSDDPADYLPAVRCSWEGVECYNYSPLVYAYGATNVSITGGGTLYAKHGRWTNWIWPDSRHADAKRLLEVVWPAEDLPVVKRDLTAIDGARFRPQFVHFNRCRDVRVEGVRIRHSPFWVLHFFACTGVRVRGVDVCAHLPNSDGVDIEMSKDVVVEDSTFCQGDDAIVVKAGYNEAGRRLGIVCENIEIRNCTVRAGFQLAAIGSEVSAGVRNVYIHDCTASSSVDNAILIKTNPERGGFIEDVRVEDIRARHLEGYPVRLTMRSLYRPTPGVPLMRTRIRNISVKRVHADEARGLYRIEGDPELPPEDIRIEGISVSRTTGEPRIMTNVR